MSTPVTPPPSSPPPASPPAREDLSGQPELRLTVALRQLLARAEHEPLTLGLIIDTTEERAFGVLMAFLCLPFLLPVTIPGSSVPFGLALLLLGAQVAWGGERPWLPGKLKRWQLPQKFATKLIGLVAKVFRPLERIIRPRMLFMHRRGPMMLVGVTLVLDGFYLSLPWPPVVPLSNTIPAWMALVKILGITEEDGLALLLGAILTVLATAGAVTGIAIGWDWVVQHYFGPK